MGVYKCFSMIYDDEWEVVNEEAVEQTADGLNYQFVDLKRK